MFHRKTIHTVMLITIMASIMVIVASSPVIARNQPAEPAVAQAGVVTPFFGPQFQISTPQNPMDADRFLPESAYNTKHRQYLVVWHNKWPGNRDIYGQRVDINGKLEGPWFAISAGPNDRIMPAIAYNEKNDEYLVVYMYDASGNGTRYEVWGQRVAWNGLLIGNSFVINTHPDVSSWTPRVAWNSDMNEYMVVSGGYNTSNMQPTDIGMRIVLADGTPDYGTILSADGYPTSPDIVFNKKENRYLVAWNRVNTSGKTVVVGDLRDSWGNRIKSDVFGIFGTNTNDCLRPRVAYTSFFYMMTCDYVIQSTDHDIYVTWINSDATIFLPAALVTGATNDTGPDIAANENRLEFMVVYQRADVNGAQIWLKPINNYLPLTELSVFQAYGMDCISPSISEGLGRYLIASAETSTMIASTQHIYGRTFSPFATFLPAALNKFFP